MEAVTYTAKSGNKRFKVVMSEAEYTANDQGGFCIGCGAEAGPVEPDARRYECESCGERLVYGLQELLIMGLLTFGE